MSEQYDPMKNPRTIVKGDQVKGLMGDKIIDVSRIDVDDKRYYFYDAKGDYLPISKGESVYKLQ